ncbi:LOW QUALITY PROTEIN: uncharacterized protein LOC112082871 [Eutrema salsugineum]|uniref:LOW QUALITY PROTEIN: uncharacterized protein LOC112082871 n=1 Tax=Eutrema salsugineum TaxID=72664 RepID=UPI000CECF33C|nr:LOW QUALITY PROTEIN: uncharacterized protein LOC112082871 [Eutrema salsugineum]
MSTWTEMLANAAMFVRIQALAFLIISTSSDIFSSKKKTKATFRFKLSSSISISHLLALISSHKGSIDFCLHEQFFVFSKP